MQPFRHRLVPVGAAVVVAVLGLPGLAGAKALAGWSQFQGGADHPGSVDEGPEPGFRTAWAIGQETGGPRSAYGLSAPVIGDGVAVAIGPTAVVAVDAQTGAPAWKLDRVLGPSVAPALAVGDDGTVVLFTEGWADGPPDASETPSASVPASASPSGTPTDGAPGQTTPRLVASSAGGEPVWTLDLPEVSRTGVTIVDELAIVGSIDGTVTAADLATGSVAWTAEVGGYLDAAVSASDDLVLVPVQGDEDTASAVVALSVTDGTEAWRYEPQTGSRSVGPPSVGEETAYVALPDGTVRAISLTDGTERWRSTLNAYVSPFSPASPPVLADGAVLVADVRGQLYRLDAETGVRIWDHAYNHPVLRSSPVVVGAHVILATTDGRIAAFALDTGDLVWEGTADTSDGEPSASPLRAMAVAGDTIVIVRGGADAGMVGLANDPGSTLIRKISPTVLDLPVLLLAWVAGLAVAAALFVLGRLLWSRLGPVEIPSEDDLVPEDDV